MQIEMNSLKASSALVSAADDHCQRTISGHLYLIQANSNTKRLNNESFSTLALRVITSTSGHLHKHTVPKTNTGTSNVNLLMPEEGKKRFKINFRVGWFGLLEFFLLAAALDTMLFIERSEVVTHCGLTFAPLMRRFVYMSEGSGQTLQCRRLWDCHTHKLCCYFHMYVHTGKWSPCTPACHPLLSAYSQNLVMLPWRHMFGFLSFRQSQPFGPDRPHLGGFSPGLNQQHPLLL